MWWNTHYTNGEAISHQFIMLLDPPNGKSWAKFGTRGQYRGRLLILSARSLKVLGIRFSNIYPHFLHIYILISSTRYMKLPISGMYGMYTSLEIPNTLYFSNELDYTMQIEVRQNNFKLTNKVHTLWTYVILNWTI